MKVILILRRDLGAQVSCDFSRDVLPYNIQEEPVAGHDLGNKRSCLSEAMPQDKVGADQASNPTAVQILSPISADHPQSRAATQGSVPEGYLESAVQESGLEIGAHHCDAET